MKPIYILLFLSIMGIQQTHATKKIIIKGVLIDSLGLNIPNTKVTLVDRKGLDAMQCWSDSSGQFEFKVNPKYISNFRIRCYNRFDLFLNLSMSTQKRIEISYGEFIQLGNKFKLPFNYFAFKHQDIVNSSIKLAFSLVGNTNPHIYYNPYWSTPYLMFDQVYQRNSKHLPDSGICGEPDDPNEYKELYYDGNLRKGRDVFYASNYKIFGTGFNRDALQQSSFEIKVK